jgi:hypothetical protein
MSVSVIFDIIMAATLLVVAPILLIILCVRLIKKKRIKWVLIGLAISALVYFGSNELGFYFYVNEGIKVTEEIFNSTNLKDMSAEEIRNELVSAEYYCFDCRGGLPFPDSQEEKLFQCVEPIIYAYAEELLLRGDEECDGVIQNLLSNLEDSMEEHENAQKLYDGVILRQNEIRVASLIEQRDASFAANDYQNAKYCCEQLKWFIPDDEVNNSIYQRCCAEESYANIFEQEKEEDWYSARDCAEEFLATIAPDDSRVSEIEKELDKINKTIEKEYSSSSSPSSSSPNNPPKVNTITNSFGSFNETDDYGHDKFDAAVVAEKIVKQNLKSPSSADFCKNSELVITLAGTAGDETSWTVTGYVDAPNSYGTVIRNHYTAQFTFTSSEAYIIDSCIFF